MCRLKQYLVGSIAIFASDWGTFTYYIWWFLYSVAATIVKLYTPGDSVPMLLSMFSALAAIACYAMMWEIAKNSRA